MAKAQTPIEVGSFVFVMKQDDNQMKRGEVMELTEGKAIVMFPYSSLTYEYDVDDLELDDLDF